MLRWAKYLFSVNVLFSYNLFIRIFHLSTFYTCLFLGFKEVSNISRQIWKGGETEALLRLQCHLQRKAFIASYGKPKMTPQSLLASPTGLAPYLRFGCLSTRLFFAKLNDLYREVSAMRFNFERLYVSFCKLLKSNLIWLKLLNT